MEFHLSSAAGHVKRAYVYLVYARVGRSATPRVAVIARYCQSSDCVTVEVTLRSVQLPISWSPCCYIPCINADPTRLQISSNFLASVNRCVFTSTQPRLWAAVVSGKHRSDPSVLPFQQMIK